MFPLLFDNLALRSFSARCARSQPSRERHPSKPLPIITGNYRFAPSIFHVIPSHPCLPPKTREDTSKSMDFFRYKNGELYCEDVPAEKIAREVGTACYVYSKATVLHHYRQIAEAFAPLKATICYSVKSCGNLNILTFLAAERCGVDVTSAGELV